MPTRAPETTAGWASGYGQAGKQGGMQTEREREREMEMGEEDEGRGGGGGRKGGGGKRI